MKLKILHLYPKEMNLYGDHGNIKAIAKRCEWRGIDVEVIDHEPGDKMPDDADIIIGGGGQDSGQNKIEKDLQKNAAKLKKYVENGTPTLVICGLYQLFGKYFLTNSGEKIQGIGVLDLFTEAGEERLIGNIILDTKEFGEVVGYENHSGLTTLGQKLEAFGVVTGGAGNNGQDMTEGARYKNCIGSYLHGPVLPKNPKIADFLIEKAIEKKTRKPAKLEKLDDKIELAAHKVAVSRPR